MCHEDTEPANSYRYGFQSQETENEIWNGALSYDHRIEDPRLGRFFTIDPLTSKYQSYSPYHFSSNQPMHAREIEGLESAHDLNPTEMTKEDRDHAYDVFIGLYDNAGSLYSSDKLTFWEWNSISNDVRDAWDAYSDMIWREFGARNIVRYLEGKGGVDIYGFDQMNVYAKFQSHVELTNNKVKSTIQQSVKNIHSPGTYQIEINEVATQLQTGGDLMGNYTTGHGTSSMIATGAMFVTINEDGSYSSWGELKYTWFDKYDWDGDNAMAYFQKQGLGIATDQQMDNLKLLGAQEFDARMYFTMKIHCDENGIISYDGKDAKDISTHAEPGGEYAIPSYNFDVINDYRDLKE